MVYCCTTQDTTECNTPSTKNAPITNTHCTRKENYTSEFGIELYRHVIDYKRVLNFNWIYLTLTAPWLQVIITVSVIHTLYSSLEHILKSSQPHVSSLRLSGNGFQGERSPSSGFPNCPRASATASNSNSSQQLNRGSSLTHSTNSSFTASASLTHWTH
jgi:hypothetical protein